MSAQGSPGRRAKNARARARQRSGWEERMRAKNGPDWQPTTCGYCADERPLRRAVVAMPAPRGPDWVLRRVRIDLFPHPKGNVVKDADGSFRMILDTDDVAKGTALYRVHSAMVCAGLDRAATG